MLQFAALFAVFLGFLSQGGRAAVQPADVVDQNKDAVDAFADTEWKVPPGLLEVNLENFETTVQGHELSVMVFFTKFSPYHRYAQRVLSNVSLAFAERSDAPGIAFCTVDLDDTPELSTYTHFNSIDVMFFYPHLILNGVRFQGNLTADEVMAKTSEMYMRSGSNLLAMNLPFTDANMKELVKHHANPQATRDHRMEALELHLNHQRDMLQAIVDIGEDTGKLAKDSNFHVQRVLRFNSRTDNIDDFLESRRKTELYANFLEHLYERKNVPQNVQTAQNMHSAAAGRKKKAEQVAATQEEAGELF